MQSRTTTFRSGGQCLPLPILHAAIAVAALAVSDAAAASRGGEVGDPAASVYTEAADVFWIVSSRGVADPESNPDDAADRLRFYQSKAFGGWSAISGSDLAEAIAGEQPVVLWIHGNRTDFRDAVRSAAQLKRVLDRIDPDHGYRLVAWSWPADRMVRGVRQDSRLKSCRSLQEAALLAYWIEQTLPHRTVVLVGYSFGAQTALKTAAQLVASRRPDGERSTAAWLTSFESGSSGFGIPGAMPSADGDGGVCPAEAAFAFALWDSHLEQSAELHVRLLAAAAACPAGSLATWLGGDTAAAPEFIGVTRNPRDPALRWYTHLWSHGGPQALGAVGPCGVPPAIADALEVRDVSCQVGRTHDWEVYLSAPGFQDLLRHALSPPAQR
mgnify:CR=1 FL=1